MTYLTDDNALLRFQRQITMPSFEYRGQEKLAASHALVVGAGGLGCAAAQYLAAAGIGCLTIIDHDKIELSNLPRQLAFTDANIGEPKADILASRCQQLNPYLQVDVLNQSFSSDSAFENADIILDCTDNFDVRYDINQYSLTENIPLVSGAAIQFDGQVSVFNPQTKDAACYECLYPRSDSANENQTCTENGVISPIVGTIGSLQALEAIKVVSDTGTPLLNRLFIYDGLHAESRTIKIRRDKNCPACGGHHHNQE